MNYLSKENVEQVIELSHLQKALLSVDTLTQVTYEWNQVTSLARLLQAWEETVHAHAALRTVYRTTKNRTVQVQLKQFPNPIDVHDLQGKSEEEYQVCLQEISKRHLNPIAIQEEPLVRAALFILDADRVVLLWTHHPLCMDDNSRDRVVSEWLQRAEGVHYVSERRSFADYISYQASVDGLPAKQYWKEELANYEPLPMLQALEGRLEYQINGLWSRTVLSSTLSRMLEQVADRYQVSYESLALAGWLLLLQVYSREDHVICGAVVSGRPSNLSGAEHIIGPLAHALPLHMKLKSEQSIDELLTAVQGKWNQLQTFDGIPVETICTYAGLAKDTVLFDSQVMVRHMHEGITRSPHYQSKYSQELIKVTVTVGTNWEIELLQSERGDSVQTLNRMQQHFVTLLESIVQQPEAKLCELNLLSRAERQLIVVDFNQSKLISPPLNRLAHQVIEQQVEKRPNQVAVICNGVSLTYQALNEQANRLAHWLREQGFGRNDLAAVLSERGIGMLVGIVAVLKAGGGYVPLDSAHPDERLLGIIDSSQAKVILTEAHLRARSQQLAQKLTPSPLVFSLDQSDGSCEDLLSIIGYSECNPTFVNNDSDLANVFFTSGSTGQPKGAMVEHIGMLNHLYAKINLLGLSENSVVAQNASHSFDISVWQFLAPLMTGGVVAIYDNEKATDPEALFRSVQVDRVTVLEMVPSMIEMILQTTACLTPEERSLPDLAFMISTGEGLPVTLCRKWLEEHPHVKVVNTYGATECSDDTLHEVISYDYPLNANPQVVLGTTIPNMKHYLLDHWLRQVPVGVVGEVFIAGVGVGRGYLNDEERTSKVYLHNPFCNEKERMYKTGDLAHFLPDGRLVFDSRVDFQVKVRGYRIELGEIESILLKHPQVRQSVALINQDNLGNNRILAYVVLSEQIEVSIIRQFLQTYLPEYMVPEHLMILEAMPLNRNGKIDRKALPQPEQSELASQYIAPRNEWEQALATIWSEVLGVLPIGIDDNFFDLGGHSMRTIQIRSRIKQQLGIELALKDLFDHQTIRELAMIFDAADVSGIHQTAVLIPKLADSDYYPMSHAQQRLYLLDCIEPENRSYNMQVAIEMKGNLHKEAFEYAVMRLLERHEALRTTFTVIEGQPVQRVGAIPSGVCTFIDLSDENEAIQQEHLTQAEHHGAQLRFNLNEGPLYQIRVYKMAADRHVLWMYMHHIIGDYWSWQVLIPELAAMYESYSKGSEPSLQPLSIQYKDYSSWQNNRLAQGELIEAERYWLTQLQDNLPILDLPTDHPRPSVQLFAAGEVTRHIDQHRLERIKLLAQEQDATLFMILLSVVGVFLSRMSGQEDIVIGTPEAGRDHMELEGLIGFFVNTLPLRLDLHANLTFQEVIAHCKKTALDAYTHHEYPFDQMVEKINPDRDTSRSPLFSVMFQLNHLPAQSIEAGEVQFCPLPVDLHMTSFDLTFVGIETEAGLDFVVQYRSDLYETSTMERWMNHFMVLLDSLLEQPTQIINQPNLLSKSERHQLLEVWNDTSIAYSGELVHRLFQVKAKQVPDAIAVEMDEMKLSYRQLDEQSERLAHFLRGQGVGPDVFVGLCMERAPELMVGLLGVLKAGGAYVPIDPSYPRERLTYLLSDSQVAVLLTQERLLAQLPSHEAVTYCLDRDWLQITTCSDCPPQRDTIEGDMAYMIYTSGSTGKPKGVMITHRGMSNYLQWAVGAYEVEQGIGSIVSSSLSFDATITSLFTPLMTGGRVVLLHEGKEIEQVSQALRQYDNLSLLKITPAHLHLLNQQLAPEELVGRVRTVVIGGEALLGENIAFWQQAAPETKLINEYGPTETVVGCCVYHAAQIKEGPVLIGRPIGNTQLYVLDSYMQPVPIGVAGELYIGGLGVARGYHNREQLTAERFVPNPFSREENDRLYKTGDICCYLADGNLQYYGRIDDQVKVRGYRIELGEIEARLHQHPAIHKAVVIPQGDGVEKRLVSYIVLESNMQVVKGELRDYCLAQLPEYMVPSAFLVLDDMPLTSNGKVDRNQLLTMDLPINLEHYSPPRDLKEYRMVQIWAEVLQAKPIGIHDNFFESGGHSLKALMLLNVIRERLGVELPLVTLFQKPTIAKLCAYMQEDIADDQLCLLRLQQGDGTHPPLILIHPQGGGILPYVHVVKALGSQETIYGLQAVGYESDVQPLTSIEAMVELYVEQVRREIPDGPYRLIGWSFGGTVAYEMARQFEALGEQVDLLGLFDVQPLDRLGEEREEFTKRDAMIYFATLFDLDPAPFAHMEMEAGLALILQQSKDRGDWPQGMTIDSLHRKIRVLVACGKATTDYRYREPIKSNLQLFRVQEISKHQHALVNPDEWSVRTTGNLQVFHVAGDHNTIAGPEHAEQLANVIRPLLLAKEPLLQS
ncbi:amino acid adenylation domain-containing protein [Paenibacillus sp. N1-5-1-14]|uniref:amino acid adenylation domain-containing protein n=1 Tax=Paenibacillus radicibacter TaxID=2972488 RepID=UPI0021595C2E|nr:non-ribosomal peptide synthetase [Paenibacillus radicibacter]MCR8643269.1 amino acid adenylation domain-containing protein [Paenibacillus radicibacter]